MCPIDEYLFIASKIRLVQKSMIFKAIQDATTYSSRQQSGHVHSRCPNNKVPRPLKQTCRGCGQKRYALVGCPDRKCLNSGEASRFIVDCTQSTQTAAQYTSPQQSSGQRVRIQHGVKMLEARIQDGKTAAPTSDLYWWVEKVCLPRYRHSHISYQYISECSSWACPACSCGNNGIVDDLSKRLFGRLSMVVAVKEWSCHPWSRSHYLAEGMDVWLAA